MIFAGLALAQSTDQLLALLANTPKLPVKGEPYKLPVALGIVSSVADDGKGLLYILQRGPENDPVIVLNREGHVVRSWGKGLYDIPHTVRLDPQGNVSDGGCRQFPGAAGSRRRDANWPRSQ